ALFPSRARLPAAGEARARVGVWPGARAHAFSGKPVGRRQQEPALPAPALPSLLQQAAGGWQTACRARPALPASSPPADGTPRTCPPAAPHGSGPRRKPPPAATPPATPP